MKIIEHDALQSAKVQGYLVTIQEHTYEVYESWWCHCETFGVPMILANRHHHSVLIDTDSIATFLGTHDNPYITTPSIMPTEKIRHDIQRMVTRYVSKARDGRATLLNSFIGMYGLWPGSEEKVVKKLLDVWNEAKFFSEQASLWERIS